MNIPSISNAVRGFFENRERKRKEKLWSVEQENGSNVSNSEYMVGQINKKQETNTNTSNKTQGKNNFVVRAPEPFKR